MLLLVWDYVLRTTRGVWCSRASVKPQELGATLCTGGAHLPMSETMRRVTGSIEVFHTAGLPQGKSPCSFWPNLFLFPRLQENMSQELICYKGEAGLLAWSVPLSASLLWLLILLWSFLCPCPHGSQLLHPHLIHWHSLCLILRITPWSRYYSDYTDETQRLREVNLPKVTKPVGRVYLLQSSFLFLWSAHFKSLVAHVGYLLAS